jgi:hypothetical protein
MREMHNEALWGCFAKTLLEFEERFGTEDACREYLVAHTLPCVAGTDGRAVIAATAVTCCASGAARFTNAPTAATRRA